LLEAFPSLQFIDGQRWPTAESPLVAGIHQCQSSLCYLWPSDLVPTLPFLELPPEQQYANIRIQGPTAGPVIQFCRCREKDGQLQFGKADATIEDPASPLGKWHAQVIAFLKKRYRCGLNCYSMNGELLNMNLRDYLVGKSILNNPTTAPSLVLYLGRDEYLLPVTKDR